MTLALFINVLIIIIIIIITGGTGRHSVNFEPPKISESTRARMLKLKTQLDFVKFSVWVQKFIRLGRLGT